MATDLLCDDFDAEFTAVKSKKSEKSDDLDFLGDFDIDSFLASTTKKTGKKRVHRYVNIVLSERKPGGYDIYLNDNGFTCKGGRKVNKIGMETIEAAQKAAVELFRKIQFNQDTHKRKKTVTCDIYQEWNETEVAPMVTSPFFSEDKPPEVKVPEWTKTIQIKVDGEWEDFTYEAVQLKYKVVDGVTRVKIPNLLKWFIKLTRGKKYCTSKNDFVGIGNFETHAKLFWRGVTITELAQWFARERNRKWSRRFANSFIKGCRRLLDSIKINLALQSVLIEKTGKPTLAELGQLIVPAKFNRDTQKEKLVSDFHFDYDRIVRAITCDEDGNVVFHGDLLKHQQAVEKFEEKWEVKEVQVAGSSDKLLLPVFKAAENKNNAAQAMAKFIEKSVRLDELKQGHRFTCGGEKFLHISTNGSVSNVLVKGKVKAVSSNITVRAMMPNK